MQLARCFAFGAVSVLLLGLPASRDPDRYDPAAVPLAAGRKALAAGDPDGAWPHLVSALTLRPRSPEIHDRVLAALSREAERALADGRYGDAVRAARILHGLAVQAGYADAGVPGLVGPKPEGVDRMVELHHERLVGWFGKDPFEDRPGRVIPVPEATDLESEGSPFWWAGGFQSGDTTVLGFTIGTIEGLGRGLTHELTHRFDGVIYPGIPAWLCEGRACWTGNAYRRSSDRAFVANHADFGAIYAALLFVDSAGLLRQAAPAGEMPPPLRRWLRAFRDHGHPPRVLPPVPARR